MEETAKKLKAGEKTASKVLAYAVFRDSLVYLFYLRGHLRAGILSTFNIALSPWETLYVNAWDTPPRIATLEDFNHYNIHPGGHIA